MPSTLATDRRGAGSRRVLSRETWPPGSGEITLSQELRTVGLLWPHVLVGYQWSHTGLRPGRKTSHNRYIRSFVSQPPWNQGDPRCSFPPWPPGPRQGWAAGSDRFWPLELRVSRTFLDQVRKRISFKAPRLRFRLVASDFPGIVCILDGDRDGTGEFIGLAP